MVVPFTVGALFSGWSIVMAECEDEDFAVALDDDERGLTVFSQPCSQQNTSVSSISG
jgi:hypothetical protein